MTIANNTFQFGLYNSLDTWGIKCIKHDILLPARRENKIIIPKKSGSYTQPGRYYEDRVVRAECIRAKEVTPTAIRQMAHELSYKRQLRFWDEPNLYYVAEIYDPPEPEIWQAYNGVNFEIIFNAEPFAYTELHTVSLQTGVNKLTYDGTYEAPTLVVIDNIGSSTISRIQITSIKRKVE